MLGRLEGTKGRPAVIVLAVRTSIGGGRKVTVAPITHSKPQSETPSIELPARIKAHLGLDEGRSWVILDETNEFIWPGYDLRPIPGKPGTYSYGVLPGKLFAKVVEGVSALWDRGQKPVKR